MIPEKAHIAVHFSLKRTPFKLIAIVGLQMFSSSEPAIIQ
jgi:hypothetical protein